MSSGAPPAITVMVPSRAAGGPPDTGASTQPIPVSRFSRAAMSRVAAGSAVDRSTRSFSGRAASATPWRPKTQLSTAAVWSTHRRTMSLASATAAGEAAGCAP